MSIGILGIGTLVHAADVISVQPLTDNILLIHFGEGKVTHHGIGQKRSDEQVVISPLDVARASLTDSYLISSKTDASYRAPQHPASTSRKSKGTDFAWFVDSFVDGHAVNKRPDHVSEHWLYLHLPKPMRPGQAYTLNLGSLASNGPMWTLKFDPKTSTSEAVHVNLIGYAPIAPEKFGYVYHWMGDGGSLFLQSLKDRQFALLENSSRKPVFTGKVKFRKDEKNQETYHKSDSPPYGNFLNAEVYECDFSTFTRPGRYVLSVEGIGTSQTFAVNADVYKEPFRVTARGLYHNRSGIELKKPFTEFTRPAPHNPALTPGFKGKLVYSTLSSLDYNSESGTKAMIEPTIKGPLDDAWGWYQDAGDWDSYSSHLRVAKELLLAYELAPKNFRDGELNIPESGNGVPDILDEAAWLPRFCYRLRHELLRKKWGTGGIGLRVAGDAFGGDGEGMPSWKDVNRLYVVSGEDAEATYSYAGVAANLAYCLELAGAKDPGGVDWQKEAIEAYKWAALNTPARHEPKVKDVRAYASASLYRLTRDRDFEQAYAKQSSDISATTLLNGNRLYAAATYAFSKMGSRGVSALATKLEAAIIHTADFICVETREKRALRWGGDFGMPMLIGQQTTPWVLEGAIGYKITQKNDPVRAKKYLAALYTTCDYFLGTNALNMTWVTGLGPRHPNQVFHMDDWYNGKNAFHPGIIPYGPWRKEKEVAAGPWDADWPNSTVYPAIDKWPGNERWYDNRCSPMNSEFTIHQNTAPAAAIFGFLCGEAKK